MLQVDRNVFAENLTRSLLHHRSYPTSKRILFGQLAIRMIVKPVRRHYFVQS